MSENVIFIGFTPKSMLPWKPFHIYMKAVQSGLQNLILKEQDFLFKKSIGFGVFYIGSHLQAHVVGP